ncbi:transposase, partial [Succinatimonas hippei]|uniref:RNA-guided endonuclease InsQ/TnpB family protein n=1 Tax=Succinatimonas hippei TaxID=626938 RepID=UPI0026F19B31
NLNTAIGIDMGVKRFLTLSDGNFIESLETKLKPLETKIALLQRRIKHKVKGSNNIKKAYIKLALLHKKKADIRNNFLHQVSTLLVKNHDLIVIEDLKIKNMSKSAQGTIDNPSKNVKAKSGLNRSILNEAWRKFFTYLEYYLEYKLKLKGGILIKVDPKHTSQTCIQCGHISKESRKEQAIFKCVKCGYETNADVNAAQNILRRAGLARIACQANLVGGRQQEPAEAYNSSTIVV